MYRRAQYQEAVYTAFRPHLKTLVPTLENPTDEGTTLQQRIILFPEVTDPSIIIRNLIAPTIKKLSDDYSKQPQQQKEELFIPTTMKRLKRTVANATNSGELISGLLVEARKLDTHTGPHTGPYINGHDQYTFEVDVASSEQEIMDALTSTMQTIEKDLKVPLQKLGHTTETIKRIYRSEAYTIAFALHLLPYYDEYDFNANLDLYFNQQLKELQTGFQLINTFISKARKQLTN